MSVQCRFFSALVLFALSGEFGSKVNAIGYRNSTVTVKRVEYHAIIWTKGTSDFCHAAIIGSRWIITTASCLLNQNVRKSSEIKITKAEAKLFVSKSSIAVFIGTQTCLEIERSFSSHDTRYFEVEKISYHKEFRYTKTVNTVHVQENDIAIIRLSRVIYHTERWCQKLRIPGPEEIFRNRPGLIAEVPGFNDVNFECEKGSESGRNTIVRAYMKVRSDDVCSKQLQTWKLTEVICASRRTEACLGQPLVIDDRGKGCTLIGLLLSQPGCSSVRTTERIIYFQRIHKYYRWITDVINMREVTEAITTPRPSTTTTPTRTTKKSTTTKPTTTTEATTTTRKLTTPRQTTKTKKPTTPKPTTTTKPPTRATRPTTTQLTTTTQATTEKVTKAVTGIASRSERSGGYAKRNIEKNITEKREYLIDGNVDLSRIKTYAVLIFLELQFRCSGGIIGPQWVVIKTICLIFRTRRGVTYTRLGGNFIPPEKILVVRGARSVTEALSFTNKSSSEHVFRVERTIIHEAFRARTLDHSSSNKSNEYAFLINMSNNLALLKLFRPLYQEDARNIFQALHLPLKMRRKQLTISRAIVFGTGENDAEKTVWEQTRSIAWKQFLSDDVCKKHLRVYNRATMICTSRIKNDKTCFEESGTPLAVCNPKSGCIIVGLRSLLFPCHNDYPHYFHTIFDQMEWIKEAMKKFEQRTTSITEIHSETGVVVEKKFWIFESNSSEHTIVTSQTVSIASYYVIILKKINSKFVPCAGGIIDSQWIVTTAACTLAAGNDAKSTIPKAVRQLFLTPESFLVAFGARSFEEAIQFAEKSSSEHIIKVETVIVHTQSTTNNIAILKLSRQLFKDDSKNISHSFRLPSWLREVDLMKMQVTVFGTAGDALYESTGIAIQQVTDSNNCKKHWPDYSKSDLICTSIGKDEKNCFIREGTPLTVCKPDSGCVIVGISSFTSRCDRGKPMVYISIFRYVAWIEVAIKKFADIRSSLTKIHSPTNVKLDETYLVIGSTYSVSERSEVRTVESGHMKLVNRDELGKLVKSPLIIVPNTVLKSIANQGLIESSQSTHEEVIQQTSVMESSQVESRTHESNVQTFESELGAIDLRVIPQKIVEGIKIVVPQLNLK